MLKKYPIGISVFVLLAFLATLFPPYKWGEERLNGRIFPIDRRGFIFGSSWSEIQIGWGWEQAPEVATIYWERSSFYDSLSVRFSRSPVCRWMNEKMPKTKNEYGFDFSGLERATDVNTKSAIPSASLARSCLNNLRGTFPQYANMNDSVLSVNIVKKCPPDLSAEGFAREMDNDSMRAKQLLLFSGLGLVTRDSLDVLNARLAPPSQAYHSTREYAHLHRQLNLAELFVDYLLIVLLAALLELGRYFLGVARNAKAKASFWFRA